MAYNPYPNQQEMAHSNYYNQDNMAYNQQTSQQDTYYYNQQDADYNYYQAEASQISPEQPKRRQTSGGGLKNGYVPKNEYNQASFADPNYDNSSTYSQNNNIPNEQLAKNTVGSFFANAKNKFFSAMNYKNKKADANSNTPYVNDTNNYAQYQQDNNQMQANQYYQQQSQVYPPMQYYNQNQGGQYNNLNGGQTNKMNYNNQSNQQAVNFEYNPSGNEIPFNQTSIEYKVGVSALSKTQDCMETIALMQQKTMFVVNMENIGEYMVRQSCEDILKGASAALNYNMIKVSSTPIYMLVPKNIILNMNESTQQLFINYSKNINPSNKGRFTQEYQEYDYTANSQYNEEQEYENTDSFRHTGYGRR